MSIEVTVPALGESIVEATVGRWYKSSGDAVTAEEPLVELETDKVNVTVASPDNGTLQAIVKDEGESVGVGDVLATIEESRVASPGPSPAAAQQETASQPNAPAAEPATANLKAGDTTATAAPNLPAGETRATPVARRIAEEHGISLGDVQGTGPGGRVSREDVETYLQHPGGPAAGAKPAAAAPAITRPAASTSTALPDEALDGRREVRERMSRRRRTIANRLVEAQHTAAMLTTFNEVDMTAILDVRKRRRDAFRERYGVGLGFMSFFTKAVVGALKPQPRLNAEIQGDEMVLKYYYDIGVAVSTDQGLVVPVVRDADRLTFAEIEREIAALAEKARNGTLSLEELRGGTFTITNGGVFGSLLSTPILNYPQSGILGMHKIQERPVVVNGEIMARPMMYLALSYDHRIVDGSEAVRFLVRVKELLEDPETLLLEG